MISGSKLGRAGLSVNIAQASVEALERLQDSYDGLQRRETLMEADLAVLVAVQFILKQVRSRQSSVS